MSEPARRPEPVPELHRRAMDNLSFIRETMARASAFTAVPGAATVVVGLTAVGAAVIAHGFLPTRGWLWTWLGEAVLAFLIGAPAMALKARKAGQSLLQNPGRRFLLAVLPSLVAGAVLTLVLLGHGLRDLFPGLWMMLYGLGVLSAGAHSVRPVPLMGLSFMVMGLLAFALPASAGDLLMGLGFGGLHVGFGLVIARRYGG